MRFETEQFFKKKQLVAVQHLLIIGKEEIGYISVDVTNKCRYKNYISVAEIFKRKNRGKGYGKMMYEHALKYHGSLATRYHNISEPAQRVWKSLVGKYYHQLDFFENTIEIYNKINS